MAKQIAIIKTQGTLDDLTFSKTKDGYIVTEYSYRSKLFNVGTWLNPGCCCQLSRVISRIEDI
jgi:hypothetical protein